MEVYFEQITGKPHQIDLLYSLLEIRAHNISHHQLPSLDEHKNFVLNNPYRIWYLIKLAKTYVGTCYLTTDNTIGINIYDSHIDECLYKTIQNITTNFDPLPPIKSVRPGYFSVNVPITNQILAVAMEKIGTKLQTTFRL